MAMLAVAGIFTASASAAPGSPFVAGVTFPFNGVWLESTDGGHYWDAGGNGLCRIDASAGAPGGFTENAGTCDVQAKKPTQAVVGPRNADGTYFVYSADMSSQSGGPVRLTYDPAADSGKGLIVANSGFVVGGLNTVGFFADAGGNFKNSSVALGPCDVNAVFKPANPGDPTPPCRALYLGFERSRKIERINFVDQPTATQSIETISKTADPRKGVRFGIGDFRNANGTDDLYIDELGGLGVTRLTDIAHCAPSEGSPDPTVINPPVNTAGGCAATVVGGITTNFPQGMAVQNDASGNGRFVYVADSPRDSSATVLRYHPDTGLQDVVSSTVAPYDSLLNPGQQVSRYTFVLGLAVNPHNGDLFIGDDPTFAVLVNPPLAKGHLFIIPGAGGVAPADCVGHAATSVPAAATADHGHALALRVRHDRAEGRDHVRAQRRRWAPVGGRPLPGPVPDGRRPPGPGLHAYNSAACDDGACSVPVARPRTTTRSCPARPTSTTCTWHRTTTSVPVSSGSPSTPARTAAPATWSTAPPWSWPPTPASTATRPTAWRWARASRARRRPASTRCTWVVCWTDSSAGSTTPRTTPAVRPSTWSR